MTRLRLAGLCVAGAAMWAALFACIAVALAQDNGVVYDAEEIGFDYTTESLSIPPSTYRLEGGGHIKVEVRVDGVLYQIELDDLLRDIVRNYDFEEVEP